MSIIHINQGIDMMLQSPNRFLTMEFQGGEALLAFDKIVYAIERTKELTIKLDRVITYVICTNLAVVTEEILAYCKDNAVLISTSLDGPSFIHNQNRKRPGNNSYELTIRGLELARKIVGHGSVSALMTATTLSLDYPIEIVDEYYRLGFRNIFLRPISPYGFALKNEKKNKYAMTRFLEFYKIALDHIIDINLKGEYFREDYATIILKKILTPFPVGYVDLNSPSGCITNAVVFNYDGAVYASDESRMLAESKDYTFRLGHLDDYSYEELFYGEKVQELADVMCNESLPGCSDCAFQSYCGSDPIHNHATQGDIWGYRPTSTFCQKNMEIISHLILLMENNADIKKVFETWVKTVKAMITLRTKGVPYGLQDFIVGVVTRDVSGMSKDHILLLEHTVEVQSGFAAILTSNTFAPQTSTPCVFSVPNLDHLNGGRHCLFREDGNIKTLYRVNSCHNMILSTERCNSNCLMCSQPPKDRNDVTETL